MTSQRTFRRCVLLTAILWGGPLGCGAEVRAVKRANTYGHREPLPPSKPAMTGASSDEVSLPAGTSAESSTSESSDTATQPAEPAFSHPHEELEKFYEALEALKRSERTDSVRVLWLGDSHTAADFMTHPVRVHLAELAGGGGAGFFRLGLAGYRHGEVRLTRSGRWRKAPILPAQRTRVLDGVFGYGGIRTLPAAGARATAELRNPGDGTTKWTLMYRLPPGAQLEVRVGESRHRLRETETDAPGRALRTSWTVPSSERFSVAHVAGDPQIFGAYAETEKPGVVLDTVGINGARAATPLAWEPEQWAFQVNERRLDLLVLAFGTNEVFDRTSPHRYKKHILELVSLARRAQSDLPCWVIGPPDSAAKGGGSKERVSSISAVYQEAAGELGCAYTSAFDEMGGPGSFARWMRERPAKARSDRIHLTIAGYQKLGESLAQALVRKRAEVSPPERVGDSETQSATQGDSPTP